MNELRIIEEESNVFNTEKEYIIPLYQRGYSWADKEIMQLIEDIRDVQEGAEYYYIGSLIVSEQNGKYEVVDGQQRLTSLYLLLNCLGYEVKNTLTFACRERANYTLEKIKSFLAGDRVQFELDRAEQSILNGIKIINQEIQKNTFNRDDFIEKLKKVVLFRIELPENTDLNRYFEIMNTRGEQLEQHDILKAVLMGKLPKDEQGMFAKIWDACSDMTGYVQMHFGTEARKTIFGWNWNKLPSEKWADYKNIAWDQNDDGENVTISDIVKTNFSVKTEDGEDEKTNKVRFESIIEFPYFLQHILRIYINLYNVKHADEEQKIVNDQLDDMKLLENFRRVEEDGVANGKKIAESEESKADFSRAIVICLLRSRFLFDKYILKREFANDDLVGAWSLKYVKEADKKPNYANTEFIRKGERNQDKKNQIRVKENIMIQSALRVSYTSPKAMHWITEMLYWLSRDHCANLENLPKYGEEAENTARRAVTNQFLIPGKEAGKYEMGVSTPHIVFNYLDFLLWRQDRNTERKYNEFVFEFRNSVEHWYPQNPSEGMFDAWIDGKDRFGNLCIVSSKANSKFSNLSPDSKKKSFTDIVSKGRIKLRIMAEKTEETDEMIASYYWKEEACKKHEEEMLHILKQACKGVE